MTTPVVLDASALVVAVIDTSSTGVQARRLLAGHRRHAPFLVDAEVGNVLRRLTLRGELTPDAASHARRLAERTVQRRHQHHGPLAERAWDLRDNVSFYDALYVALAEALHCPLITADARLGRALPSHDLIQVIGVP